MRTHTRSTTYEPPALRTQPRAPNGAGEPFLDASGAKPRSIAIPPPKDPGRHSHEDPIGDPSPCRHRALTRSFLDRFDHGTRYGFHAAAGISATASMPAKIEPGPVAVGATRRESGRILWTMWLSGIGCRAGRAHPPSIDAAKTVAAAIRIRARVHDWRDDMCAPCKSCLEQAGAQNAPPRAANPYVAIRRRAECGGVKHPRERGSFRAPVVLPPTAPSPRGTPPRHCRASESSANDHQAKAEAEQLGAARGDLPGIHLGYASDSDGDSQIVRRDALKRIADDSRPATRADSWSAREADPKATPWHPGGTPSKRTSVNRRWSIHITL